MENQRSNPVLFTQELTIVCCESSFRFKIISTTEPAMLSKLKYPTLSYKYDDEEEFIFCIRGKPFPCLVSPKLPTPASTLLDYDVVRDLGLKMTNLQCQRYQIAGQKLRILGNVSLQRLRALLKTRVEMSLILFDK